MGVWRERNHANLKLVRAFVKKLREKLDDGPDPMGYILTEGRAGYRTLSRQAPGAIRGFHVPLEKYAGLGACYRPGSVWTTHVNASYDNVLPSLQHRLVKRDNHFRLYTFTVFITGSDFFDLTNYLALTRFVVTRRARLSRFAPRTTLSSCFVTYVRAALDS